MEPPLTDTPNSGQPPYSGHHLMHQLICPIELIDYLIPNSGQPPSSELRTSSGDEMIMQYKNEFYSIIINGQVGVVIRVGGAIS